MNEEDLVQLFKDLTRSRDVLENATKRIAELEKEWRKDEERKKEEANNDFS